MALDTAKPQQVILVSTRGKADVMGKQSVKDNILTMAWHTPLSFDPPLYGISVGKNRFTCKLISESKVFCVNFIDHSMKQAALGCGQTTGAGTDKFAQFNLTKEECDTIDCPRIAGSAGWLECEVVDSFETGDHIFFVGHVNKESQGKDGQRLLYAGDNKFTTVM